MQDHFEQIIYRVIASSVVELAKHTLFKTKLKKQKNKRSKKRKK